MNPFDLDALRASVLFVGDLGGPARDFTTPLEPTEAEAFEVREGAPASADLTDLVDGMPAGARVDVISMSRAEIAEELDAPEPRLTGFWGLLVREQFASYEDASGRVHLPRLRPYSLLVIGGPLSEDDGPWLDALGPTLDAAGCAVVGRGAPPAAVAHLLSTTAPGPLVRDALAENPSTDEGRALRARVDAHREAVDRHVEARQRERGLAAGLRRRARTYAHDPAAAPEALRPLAERAHQAREEEQRVLAQRDALEALRDQIERSRSTARAEVRAHAEQRREAERRGDAAAAAFAERLRAQGLVHVELLETLMASAVAGLRAYADRARAVGRTQAEHALTLALREERGLPPATEERVPSAFDVFDQMAEASSTDEG